MTMDAICEEDEGEEEEEDDDGSWEEDPRGGGRGGKGRRYSLEDILKKSPEKGEKPPESENEVPHEHSPVRVPASTHCRVCLDTPSRTPPLVLSFLSRPRPSFLRELPSPFRSSLNCRYVINTCLIRGLC